MSVNTVGDVTVESTSMVGMGAGKMRACVEREKNEQKRKQDTICYKL